MRGTERRLFIMSRFSLAVAVILLTCMFAGIAFAGGTPMTSKGDKQLVFHFNGLCHLRLDPYFRSGGFLTACAAAMQECYGYEYDHCDDIVAVCDPCGGGIGFRYFINDDRAVRAGVNIAYGSVKDELADEDGSCLEFGASVIYERYLPVIHSVAPYLGGGLRFSYASAEATYEGTTIMEGTGTFIDVMGVAGFQWYFTDALSLGGEYRGMLSYETVETKEWDGDSLEKSGDLGATRFHWKAASIFFGAHF
jgi:hypothetical protein